MPVCVDVRGTCGEWDVMSTGKGKKNKQMEIFLSWWMSSTLDFVLPAIKYPMLENSDDRGKANIMKTKTKNNNQREIDAALFSICSGFLLAGLCHVVHQ